VYAAGVETVANGRAAEGDETHTIPLKNDFSIWINNKVAGEFQKSGDEWKNKDPHAFTNWAFFQDFVDSLNEFPVDFHLDEANVNPSAQKFELHSGDKVFVFAKVGDRTWAVKFPNGKEFLASRNFSIYGDMDASSWASPMEKNLRILQDVTAQPAARMAALKNVMDSCSSDVKTVMSHILSTEGENEALRQEIVHVIRRQPTDQNMKLLMGVLQTSKDELLLNQVSKALRVRNPKGPVIELDDQSPDIQRKIATWQAWGSKFK